MATASSTITRAVFLTQLLAFLISGASRETPAPTRQRIPFVFSGGVEGVLSPTYSVFTGYLRPCSC